MDPDEHPLRTLADELFIATDAQDRDAVRTHSAGDSPS
jgi:hypothetical protein